MMASNICISTLETTLNINLFWGGAKLYSQYEIYESEIFVLILTLTFNTNVVQWSKVTKCNYTRNILKYNNFEVPTIVIQQL